eukprot:CFRG2922T1
MNFNSWMSGNASSTPNDVTEAEGDCEDTHDDTVALVDEQKLADVPSTSNLSDENLLNATKSWWHLTQKSLKNVAGSAAKSAQVAATKAQEMSKAATASASEMSTTAVKRASEFSETAVKNVSTYSTEIVTASDGEATHTDVRTEKSGDSTIPAEASTMSNDIATKANMFGSAFVSGLTDLGSKVRSTVGTLAEDWEKEHSKFLAEKKPSTVFQNESGLIPLWAGFSDEESIKAQVLALSLDKRNFMVDPPSGNDFHFDLDIFSAACMSAMKHDPRVETVRYELVPKRITETRFWRNYLYRVSLIKQQATLASMQNDVDGTGSELIKSNANNSTGTSIVDIDMELQRSPPPAPKRLMHRDTDIDNEIPDNFHSEAKASTLKEKENESDDDFEVSDLDDIEAELGELDIDGFGDLDVDDFSELMQ